MTTVSSSKATKTKAAPKPKQRRSLQDTRVRVKARPPRRKLLLRSTPDAYPLIVRNYVCTAHLFIPVPMRTVAECEIGRYDRARFPSCVFRDYFPRDTIELFPTSKTVVTGAANKAQALLAVYQKADQLSDLFGCRVEVANFHVENVVGSAALGYRLNLDLFNADHKDQCMFAPEKFGAARYWADTEKEKPIAIIFSSGKMVITGGHCQEDLEKVFKQTEWSKYKLGSEYRELDPRERRTRVIPVGHEAATAAYKQQKKAKKKERQQQQQQQPQQQQQQQSGVV